MNGYHLSETPRKCDFCREEALPDVDFAMSHEFAVVGDSLYYADPEFGWEGIKVNFCPMCGRKLIN